MKNYYIARDKSGGTFLFFGRPRWNKDSEEWLTKNTGDIALTGLPTHLNLNPGECKQVKIVIESNFEGEEMKTPVVLNIFKEQIESKSQQVKVTQNKIHISQRMAGEIVCNLEDYIQMREFYYNKLSNPDACAENSRIKERTQSLKELLKEARHNHNDRIVHICHPLEDEIDPNNINAKY